jgi:Xaa-Pro aminopeptidase
VEADVLSLAAANALHSSLSARALPCAPSWICLPGSGRPPLLPQAAIYPHLAPFASTSRQDKLARYGRPCSKPADYHFISTLDDIAWLLNLRGADVNYNPVFISHLLLSPDSATLFVDSHKVDARLQAELAADGVQLADYHHAKDALAACLPTKPCCWTRAASRWASSGHADACPAVQAINPSTMLKACKTAAEAEHIRHTMEQDGAAL